MTDLIELMGAAEAAVGRACDLIRAMRQGELETVRKERLDIVTAADLAAEKLLMAELGRLTPGAVILSEEAQVGKADAAIGRAPTWIIDPVDGTVNYACGLPWYSVTVAYQEDGRTVLGLIDAPEAGLKGRYVAGEHALVNGRPVRATRTAALSDAVVSVVLAAHFAPEIEERTIAILRRLARDARGVRIIISGAYEMALVAAGQLDGFVNLGADLFSHAAAMPLVRAAGGRVTTLDGTDATDSDRQRVTSNGPIHEALLACIARA